MAGPAAKHPQPAGSRGQRGRGQRERVPGLAFQKCLLLSARGFPLFQNGKKERGARKLLEIYKINSECVGGTACFVEELCTWFEGRIGECLLF